MKGKVRVLWLNHWGLRYGMAKAGTELSKLVTITIIFG